METNAPASLDLEGIKARRDAATPGPWESQKNSCNFGIYSQTAKGGDFRRLNVANVNCYTDAQRTRAASNADFIAHARTDIPLLLTEVERLRGENARYRELLSRAVSGLKWIGKFRYKNGDEPHSLDCSLAGRVSRVFCTGMTRSIALCREFEQDPEHCESQTGGAP